MSPSLPLLSTLRALLISSLVMPLDFFGYPVENLQLIDIGKPETLAKAEEFIRSLGK